MTAQRAIRHQHDDWLNLLERSGPFLTVPVLSRIWPAGLDPVPGEAMDEIRPAFDAWREDPAGGQRPWISFVLGGLLDWGDCLIQGPDVPVDLQTAVPEHDAAIRADFAFRASDGTIRLAGVVLPPGIKPAARTVGGWSASPADRLAVLLRRFEVPLGLATDGRWWALVWAPPQGVTSVAMWDAGLWIEERTTLAAFRCLLERRRFLGVPDTETLPALLVAALDQQAEITEGLGRQVRQAVEMLVQTIGRVGRRGGPAEGLVTTLEPDEVYHGAVTVMMRLLFLLYAEERLLLPADDEFYRASYSAGGLVGALRDEANRATEEALELHTAGWQRLLALFRGVHRGIAHDRLRLPAYGGVIFDPDRHPWLEGRTSAEAPLGERVLPIDDRTVLHALEALQFVQIGDERRRLTFRTLDVEQIGYVYEGLLGYDARRADEPVVGLVGRSGEEPEFTITELQQVGRNVAALAERTGLSEVRVQRMMASDKDADREQLLRVACSGDDGLMSAAQPFAGLLRKDLRGLPMVIPAGGLYVTVSPRRRLSGTHYTPRELAEQVVVGALEPLVYSPGPLETDDRSKWRRRPSGELLGLKVADIAMGSGAFLVSACRYLAGELIEAWAAEGNPRALERQREVDGVAVDAESDPLVIEARREVIERCLYGGDINEMAVEMAKLSLWLISLAWERPFSFLDDRLVCGDSLLGLTSLDQLRMLHLDPQAARRKAGEMGFDLWGLVRETLDKVEQLRRDIAEQPLRDVRDAQAKARLLHEADQLARPLAAIADAMVGTAMVAAGARRDASDEFGRVAESARKLLQEAEPAARAGLLSELEDAVAYQLDTGRPEGAFERRPTHWPLAFPEVFETGGFDAVIGNPPFLGGWKLTGAFGVAYREFLVEWVAGGARGSADLLAYFLLVAHRLLNEGGQTGLIGTNTMAQGDTREVGLDQLTSDGATIRAAIKSAHWPTRTVNLEYAVLWSSRATPAAGVPCVLEGRSVSHITSSLDPAEADLGKPFRLAANADITFEGSKPYGMGFTMAEAEARRLIEQDSRNREVLFPFINGDDLTSRPDGSASRWVINFRDWPLERAEGYPACIAIVRARVKPEREQNRSSRAAKERWWQFERLRAELYKAIEGMTDVLLIAVTSKVVTPVRVATGMVYSNTTDVFTYQDGGHLALLSSAFHYWWTITYASTLESRIRYTPSDVFETFPQPGITPRMSAAGEALEAHRRPLMLDWQLGLTALYNRVNDPAVREEGVERLRALHIEIDRAVAEAYDWDDLRLEHGFHETRQGVRFTVSAAAREAILDRLLELNHRRHDEEVAARGGVLDL
jgi:hypothetical protein